MIHLLRIAVVVFGAGFILIGLVAGIGPGFPIAERPPRPLSVLLLQSAMSLIYGSTLVVAGFVRPRKRFESSALIGLLILAPLGLWMMSSTPIDASLLFVVFYTLLTAAGIFVVVLRTRGERDEEADSNDPI